MLPFPGTEDVDGKGDGIATGQDLHVAINGMGKDP